MQKINKTAVFLSITFSVNLLMVLIFVLSGYEYTGLSATILGISYMFVPMVAAFIVEKGIHKQPVRRTLKISFSFNRWFITGWLLPLVLAILTLGISLLFPGIVFSPDMEGMFKRFEETLNPEQLEQMRQAMNLLPVHPFWIGIVQGLIAGITINAVAAFGEELGWRGFLIAEFKEMSFWKASLWIGFIWGIWHAPVILLGHNYPQHPELGVFMMTAWCILLAPLFTYITIKAKSVIAASILHGTINAFAGVPIMVIMGGDDLLVGFTGLAGFVALFIVLAGFFLFDKHITGENIMGSPISRFW